MSEIKENSQGLLKLYVKSNKELLSLLYDAPEMQHHLNISSPEFRPPMCLCEYDCSEECHKAFAEWEERRPEIERLRLNHLPDCPACQWELRLIKAKVTTYWMRGDYDWISNIPKRQAEEGRYKWINTKH